MPASAINSNEGTLEGEQDAAHMNYQDQIAVTKNKNSKDSSRQKLMNTVPN